MLANPTGVPLDRLVPGEEMFAHASSLHGQQHVARVMILGFLLVERLGAREEAARLWAATYLHDLGRLHDGPCLEHGKSAVQRLNATPELRELFSEGGVVEDDYEAIEVAVTNHCLPVELPKNHPHWRLTALLKDADGLDRVRLGDLDAGYLRFDASRGLIDFAKELYDGTQWTVDAGPAYMTRLWPIAEQLASRLA